MFLLPYAGTALANSIIPCLIIIFDLQFCSVIGAIIISVGFYVVMWGKVKEEVVEDNSSLESPGISDPLLQ